jgi:hypothetical protein
VATQQANEERQRREERRGEGAQNRGEGEERGRSRDLGGSWRFEMISKRQQY